MVHIRNLRGKLRRIRTIRKLSEMSGGRDTAVSKKKTSARKKHGKKSIRDRIFQFPRKMTGRLFLLLILCAVLSLFSFRYMMQMQTWVYTELVKRGLTSFNPAEIAAELQEKAKYISFKETGEKELKKLLDVEKYDDGYTMMAFYDEESLFQFYEIGRAHV